MKPVSVKPANQDGDPDRDFQAGRRRALLTGGIALAALGGFGLRRLTMVAPARAADGLAGNGAKLEVMHSDAEWQQLLTPAQYRVLRQQGTEPPYSSPLDHEKRKGTFACAGCANPLYSSDTKFDSGTGWPSFYRPLPKAVNETSDDSLGMRRTEIHCRRCGGHLGHVFDDGPQPTGLRYCMNGVALTFAAAA